MPVSKLPTATFGIGWHASHATLYASAVKIHKCIFVALGLIVFHVKPYEAREAENYLYGQFY